MGRRGVEEKLPIQPLMTSVVLHQPSDGSRRKPRIRRAGLEPLEKIAFQHEGML